MHKYEIENLFATLDVLREELYSYSGCKAGGPLHIITDDKNLSNQDLDFCFEYLKTCSYESVVVVSASAIIQCLQQLTHAQRYIWAYAWKYTDAAQAALDMKDYKVIWSEYTDKLIPSDGFDQNEE